MTDKYIITNDLESLKTFASNIDAAIGLPRVDIKSTVNNLNTQFEPCITERYAVIIKHSDGVHYAYPWDGTVDGIVTNHIDVPALNIFGIYDVKELDESWADATDVIM